MQDASTINCVSQLYGGPAPDDKLGSVAYQVRVQRDLLHRDIEDICRQHNIQRSDIVTACRYKDVQLAKEKICVIAYDRLGHLLSTVELAREINVKRTTMMGAVDRWRERNYGHLHKRKYVAGTIRGHYKNCYVPKGQGCQSHKEKKEKETKD
jgi:hypothetical protein